MRKIKDAAADSLANRRIAVTGVSRSGKDHGADTVYVRLRSRDYDVFAVNPNAEEVEGDACSPDLASIPGGVDAAVIDGGCPLVFAPTADVAHKVMKPILTLTGSVPRKV